MPDSQTECLSGTSSLLEALLLTPIPSHTGCDSRNDLYQDRDEVSALLQMLLTTPLPSVQPLRLTELWRINKRHDSLVQEWLRRDRLEPWLVGTQRALLVVSIVVLGTWATLGPIGNWIHKRYAPSVVPALIRQPTASLPALAPMVKSATLPIHSSKAQQVVGSNENNMNSSQPDALAPSQMMGVAPVALPPQPNHLMIPSIGLDTLVVEVFTIDGEWDVAKYAVGYLNGTGLPGEANNMIFAGHAGFFGGVFANLHALASNDDVYVDAAGWRYHYRVRKVLVVWPTQTEYLFATDTPMLTLITCTNWDTQREVVIADFIGSKPL